MGKNKHPHVTLITKRRVEYFNFRCKIQLDLPVQHRIRGRAAHVDEPGQGEGNQAAVRVLRRFQRTQPRVAESLDGLVPRTGMWL